MSQTRFDRFYRITNQAIIDAYNDESARTNEMLHAMQKLGKQIDAEAALTIRMRGVTAEVFRLNNYGDRDDQNIWTKKDDHGYSRLKASRSSKWSQYEKDSHKFVATEMKKLVKEHPPILQGEYLTWLGVCINQIQLGGRTSVIGKDGALYLAIKFQVDLEQVGGVEPMLPGDFEQALKDNEEDMNDAS